MDFLKILREQIKKFEETFFEILAFGPDLIIAWTTHPF